MSQIPKQVTGQVARHEIRFSPLIKRWSVVILVGLLVALVLHTAEVMPPFVWAVVTAFVLNGPLKTLTKKYSLPRWFWTTVIFLIFFVIITVALVLIIPAITKEAKVLANDAPAIQQQFDDYLSNNSTINILGVSFSTDTARSAIDEATKRIPQIAQDLGPRLLSGTFRFLIDFLLYLVVTFYLMLLGGRPLWRFVEALPLQGRGEIRNLMTRIDRVLGAYIKGQFLLILIMSVASFIIMTIIDIRYAAILAIMVGVLELIPFVGPYLAISISCAVAFFQPHGPHISYGMDGITLAIVLGVALFTLRQIEDYLVIPNLIGKIVELPALLIIFTVVVAAALLGPMGLLLGVPIVAVIRIVIHYVFYKLLHGDRTKVLVTAQTDLEILYQDLAAQPYGSRFLLVIDQPEEFLSKPGLVQRLRELSQEKMIDIAVSVGEEDKIRNQFRKAGFPVIAPELAEIGLPDHHTFATLS